MPVNIKNSFVMGMVMGALAATPAFAKTVNLVCEDGFTKGWELLRINFDARTITNRRPNEQELTDPNLGERGSYDGGNNWTAPVTITGQSITWSGGGFADVNNAIVVKWRIYRTSLKMLALFNLGTNEVWGPVRSCKIAKMEAPQF